MLIVWVKILQVHSLRGGHVRRGQGDLELEQLEASPQEQTPTTVDPVRFANNRHDRVG